MFAFLPLIFRSLWSKYGTKAIIALGVVAVVVGVAIFVWFDIKRRENAAADAAVAQLKLEQAEHQMKLIEQDQHNIARNTILFNERMKLIREDFQNRANALSHEAIEQSIQDDPNLLEQQINKATQEQLKRFEEHTK